MDKRPLGIFTPFFRWRWCFVPQARQRLLDLVQVDDLSDEEQSVLNEMVLDEDPRLFDLLNRYEELGRWSNDPLPKRKRK